MKALQLLNALKLVQGAVSKEKDLVEIVDGKLRTADGVWFASAKLGASAEMMMSFNKLRSIAGLVPPTDEVTVSQKNINCLVKSGASVWKLNLRGDELPTFPVMNGVETHRIGGHEIINAIKALKSLMKTDLSRPGLLSSWLSPSGEMICGDGARLGGYQLGSAYDIELPNSVLLELYRILGVVMSEAVQIEQSEDIVHLVMDVCDIFAPPLPDKFEREWADRVREQLESEAEGSFTLSRSAFLDAINAVKVVSGFNLVELTVHSDHVLLKTTDESAQVAVSRVNAKSDYSGQVLVDLSHLDSAVQSRKDEMLKFSVSEQVVELRDQESWEVLVRKQP